MLFVRSCRGVAISSRRICDAGVPCFVGFGIGGWSCCDLLASIAGRLCISSRVPWVVDILLSCLERHNSFSERNALAELPI